MGSFIGIKSIYVVRPEPGLPIWPLWITHWGIKVNQSMSSQISRCCKGIFSAEQFRTAHREYVLSEQSLRRAAGIMSLTKFDSNINAIAYRIHTPDGRIDPYLNLWICCSEINDPRHQPSSSKCRRRTDCKHIPVFLISDPINRGHHSFKCLA